MTAPKQAKWKEFERIVAAVEFATTRGAKVAWNEDIEGRQFDVTVRFANGPHRYLTLIECKKHKRPVSVDNVDAFATKARDARANKSVIISASGFQTGCAAVAKRHGIDLFRLTERLIGPPGADELLETLTLGAYDFVVRFPNGREPLPIPETNNRLDYLLDHGIVLRAGEIVPLKALLDGFIQEMPRPSKINTPHKVEIPLSGATMVIPTLLEASQVGSLSFTVVSTMKKFLPATGMDHHLMVKLNTHFELTDCVTGCPVTAVVALDLPIGFETDFKVGSFYENMLEQSYYCERLENGKVWLVLVECYSHGKLVQARMTAEATVSKYYVEVTRSEEVQRLRKMYKRFSATRPSAGG